MNSEDREMDQHLSSIGNLNIDAEKRNLLQNIAIKLDEDSRDRFMHFLSLYKAGLVDVDIQASKWSKSKWEVKFKPNQIGKAIKNLLELEE